MPQAASFLLVIPEGNLRFASIRKTASGANHFRKPPIKPVPLRARLQSLS
jgi:hypothetical protein